jgi:hypothetical protein
MTKVDRKIASSDTISVSVGHGLDSMNSIQIVNSAMWRLNRPGFGGDFLSWKDDLHAEAVPEGTP